MHPRNALPIDPASDVVRRVHWCETADGWRLQVMSFAPVSGELQYRWPWLCVHGFSQSHRTWTAGGFARKLAALGCAVYVLDLRGHGGSIRASQRRPLPHDIERGWGIDAYFQQDLPAAMSLVQRLHPSDDMILCGHSMGGILTAAEVIQRREQDIAAFVPIAAPFSPANMSRRVRLAAAANRGVGPLTRKVRAAGNWRQLPMAHFFSLLDKVYFDRRSRRDRLLPMFAPLDQWQLLPRVWTPSHMEAHVIRDILRHSFPEPMEVVDEFSRWIKADALLLGHPSARDYTRSFHHITVPIVAAWGEADLLAPPRTGDYFCSQVRSSWHQHLSLPGANHVDITAGSPADMILHAIQRMLRHMA